MPPIRQAQIYHSVYDCHIRSSEGSSHSELCCIPCHPSIDLPADALLSAPVAAGQRPALACVVSDKRLRKHRVSQLESMHVVKVLGEMLEGCLLGDNSRCVAASEATMSK